MRANHFILYQIMKGLCYTEQQKYEKGVIKARSSTHIVGSIMNIVSSLVTTNSYNVHRLMV